MNDYFRELRGVGGWEQCSEPSGVQRYYLGWAYLVNKELMDSWRSGCDDTSSLDGLCERILDFDKGLSEDFDFENRDYHYDERSWNSIHPRKALRLADKLPGVDYVVPIARGATPPGILLAQYLGCGVKPLLLSRHKLRMEEPCPRELCLDGTALLLEEDHNSGSGGTIELAKSFVSADRVLTASIVTHYLASKLDFFGEYDYS